MKKSFPFASLLVALALLPSQAATYYFDVNGTTAGSGVASSGSYNWNDANWASDNTGTSATLNPGWGSPGHTVNIVSTADAGVLPFTLVLPGAQTWVTGVNVNSGNVTVDGTAGGTNFVSNNATWDVATGATLTVTGAGINTHTGVTVTGGGNMNVSSFWNNISGITKNGTGILTLTGNSTYTQSLAINNGTVVVGTGGSTGNLGTGATSIASGATLRFDNANTTVNKIVANNTSGSGTMEFKGYNASTALQNGIYELTGNNSLFTGAIVLDRAMLWNNVPSDLGTASISVGDRATISFNGGTFTNAITIQNATETGWHHNVGGDVVLGAIRLEGTSVLTGNIVLNNTAAIVLGDNSGKNSTIAGWSVGNHTLSGVISGPGNLAMSRFTSWNNGSTQDVNITLSGTSSNTFTGTTVVDGQGAKASLILAKSGGAVAIAPNTIVQMGSQTGGQANLRMGANDQFGAGVVMNFVNASGQWMRFELQGTTQTLAGLTAGNLTTQGGAVIQNQNVNHTDPGANATLTLNGSGSYVYNGYIRDQDNGGTTRKLALTKSGSGSQTLVGSAINYTGDTTVNNGSLILHNATAFRSATTVENGGVLTLANTGNMGLGTGATFLLNSGAKLEHNGLTDGGDYITLAGAVTVSGNTTIHQKSVTNTTGSNKNLFLDGGLKGSGTVTIDATNAGNSVVFRNNNSTFTGSMIVTGIASTTANAGSGIAVGGATTALQNTDITLNGTMELLNQGIGWAATASGDFWMGALNGSGVMVGNFTAGGETRVRVGYTNNNGSYSGTIANGTGNVIRMTKVGTGTQTFSGNNIVYTGSTTVSAGTFQLTNTGSFNSSIDNAATVELNATSGDSLTIQNGRTLSGAGVWNKTGAGRATFANSTITASGQFNIQQGTLRNNNNSSNWSGSTADIAISSGAILDLYADPVFVDQLTGTGIVQNNYGNGGGFSGSGQYIENLVVGVGNGSSTFDGVIRNNSGSNSPASATAGGGISLIKNGTGLFTLTGANTYTGSTTVNGGELRIDGSITSAVTVNNGGTLSGVGTIAGSMTFGTGATLSPGDSPGILTTSSSVLLGPGSFFELDLAIGGSSAPGNGLTGTDQLIVNGAANTITITDAILTGTWGGNLSNIYKGTLAPDNMLWVILNNTSNPITGSLFANATASPGLDGLFGTSSEAYITGIGGQTFALFYGANSSTTALTGGNDLLLIAIPEPSRAMLGLFALVPLALHRRRR